MGRICTVRDVSMTLLAPDRSRDRRIEDPTNLWIIHPCGRFLLPWFVSHGISANAVSIGGLLVGALAAMAYFNWQTWPFASVGLLLSMTWLVADGLDGMIARATNTATPLGRFLDGVCDHGVFILIYVALALSLGTRQAWALAFAAGAVHALQSNLYEGERARFHRRSGGVASARTVAGGNSLLIAYDQVAGVVDKLATRFDNFLREYADPPRLGATYGASAAKPLRLMSLLSANVRVYVIFLACIAGDPRFFWWFELVPQTLILAVGLAWHRAVEAHLVRNFARSSAAFSNLPSTLSKDVKTR